MKTLPQQEAAVLADEVEAQAYSDLYAAAPKALRDRLGLRVERLDGATLLIAPGLPTPMFNRAIGLGMTVEASIAAVDAVIDVYRRAGSTAWWLHWNPHALPADMPSHLLNMGFTQAARSSWAKMLRQPDPMQPMPTELTVAPAEGDQAGAVAQAIALAFGMPPVMADWMRELHGRARWHVYAVSDGMQVVGGGCLFLTDSLAWLGMGSVIASHRRRGGQGALMARRIEDGIALGARCLVTETGEQMAGEPNPSLGNMLRCGFVKVASRLNFEGPQQT